MRMNLTEAGKRIGKSRTTVLKLINAGLLDAEIDPLNGRKVVTEQALQKYDTMFKTFVPATQETQPSQSSHAG